MRESDFRLPTKDGASLFVREFLPDATVKAVVQIVHGMAEHSARYARLARALADHGYATYANDHRGHGKTAANREDLGYFADENGWELVVSDQLALLEEIRSRCPDVPVYLFGHSMGSFVARAAATRPAANWAGLFICGTSHGVPAVQRINRALPLLERARLGKRGRSAAISKLTFESFNAKFDDPRTSADWLSRDPAEVDKYLADPFCGFSCSNQLWLDVFDGMAEVFSPDSIAKLPRSLPICVIAGERDPLHGKLKDIRRLHQELEKQGFKNVTVRVYPEARHELLNETNRDEVTRDILSWLDQQQQQLAT